MSIILGVIDMDKDIEAILKESLKRLREKKSGSVTGNCLTEQEFASLIERKLPESERKPLLEHLLSCDKCADMLKGHLSVWEEIEKEGLLDTPKDAVQAAMDLVKPKETPRPTSERLHEKELVTTMPFGEQRYLFERRSPLTIRNFKVVYAPLLSRKRRGGPLKTINKICFTVNYSCYTYLFLIKKERVNIIVRNQQFPMNAKNELLIKTKKPLIISKRERFVLVFSREFFKNISSVKKLLLNTFGFGARKVGNMLREMIKDEDIVVKFL